MARNDGPDREMERRLREHFSEEARELRAPDDLWARLEGRLGKTAGAASRLPASRNGLH